MEVRPASIWLKSGDSVTYTVTISNTGAPLGKWHFGSLTWQEEILRNRAYSPIVMGGVKDPGLAQMELNGSGRGVTHSSDASSVRREADSHALTRRGTSDASVPGEEIRYRVRIPIAVHESRFCAQVLAERRFP